MLCQHASRPGGADSRAFQRQREWRRSVPRQERYHGRLRRSAAITVQQLAKVRGGVEVRPSPPMNHPIRAWQEVLKGVLSPLSNKVNAGEKHDTVHK